MAAALAFENEQAICPLRERPGSRRMGSHVPVRIGPGRQHPTGRLQLRVHHAFAVAHEDYPATLDHLRAKGVEITFEEDRQGGVVNGPRAYFHDPDGTVLEFIDLTSYAGTNS